MKKIKLWLNRQMGINSYTGATFHQFQHGQFQGGKALLRSGGVDGLGTHVGLICLNLPLYNTGLSAYRVNDDHFLRFHTFTHPPFCGRPIEAPDVYV